MNNVSCKVNCVQISVYMHVITMIILRFIEVQVYRTLSLEIN